MLSGLPYGKPSPPKRHWIGPRALTMLTLLCAAYVFTQGKGHPLPSRTCEKGPLLTLDVCDKDNSNAQAPSQWSYSYASGAINPIICNQISLNPAQIDIPLSNQSTPEPLFKTDCRVLELDNTHICYASQHLLADASRRVITTFSTSSHCGDTRFFRGTNIMLENGKPTPITDWKTASKNIAEIK